MKIYRQGDPLGKLRQCCDVCGQGIEHPPGPGRPRRYCDSQCAREAKNAARRLSELPPHRAEPS